ncbi:hypothetical protein F951_02231 [Acinetobacter soli CIP 110264]|uniref:hypothetical protein n=1 Tax=Acinetobacter soli TaxID=487316 RepID=UPI0002CDA3F9|nr:hypothetical protein [Acinetobacter soli]ENV56533.1 hypothetical protein F951_02231 [Acinetobacter soli CIP 110264]
MFNVLKKIFRKKENNIEIKETKIIRFEFDNERMIAEYDTIDTRKIYYRDLKSIFIIFYDEYLPIPLWNFVSDEYYISISNDYATDIQSLIDILSNQLEGFDEQSHQEIINAMGATSGLFHIWSKR